MGGAIILLCLVGMAGCANGPTRGRSAARTTTVAAAAAPATTSTTDVPTTTTTTIACPLSGGSGAAITVPVDQVCPGLGSPYFATPQSAMAYLATAWNSGNVQDLDYVTDPDGRSEMDSMAAEMVDLQFTSCSANTTGDYTCFFNHDIAPSASTTTTYPDPGGYPPGEAVFTVAPAATSGWYLTDVLHCG
jgi:hypothetical protein